MKPNPRPDLHGAPVYLPDVGDIVKNPIKWEREIRWMGQMFWQLLDDITSAEEDRGEISEQQYDAGFEDGYDHRGERDTHEGQLSEDDI